MSIDEYEVHGAEPSVDRPVILLSSHESQLSLELDSE